MHAFHQQVVPLSIAQLKASVTLWISMEMKNSLNKLLLVLVTIPPASHSQSLSLLKYKLSGHIYSIYTTSIKPKLNKKIKFANQIFFKLNGKNNKNTIKENIEIKITKKINIFSKNYSCICFPEMERIHFRVQNVLTSILWTSNKDYQTSCFFFRFKCITILGININPFLLKFVLKTTIDKLFIFH